MAAAAATAAIVTAADGAKKKDKRQPAAAAPAPTDASGTSEGDKGDFTSLCFVYFPHWLPVYWRESIVSFKFIAAIGATDELLVRQLDLRVGRILRAWRHPEAEK